MSFEDLGAPVWAMDGWAGLKPQLSVGQDFISLGHPVFYQGPPVKEGDRGLSDLGSPVLAFLRKALSQTGLG
jgi:hypothetical protein